MNPNCKAIIFDLDGTLLNSLTDLADAVNRVLKGYNLPTHKPEAYRYFIGDGAQMLISRALPEEQRNEQMIQDCLEAFKKDYAQNWHNQSALYPDIAGLLDRLSEQGIRLAILSNKPHEFTRQCVDYYLSRWTFDIVLGQSASLPQKPHPAGALHIARETGIAPASFLYAGDSGVDMQTAVSSGMYAIGVLWGYRPAAELRANGADVLVSRPIEILDYCTYD